MKLLKKHLGKLEQSASIKLGFSATDLINLSIGVPILNNKALHDYRPSISHNYCRAEYSESARQNLVRLCFEEHKLASTIIPTLGAKGALSLLFQVLDISKVAILAPSWLGYQSLGEINDLPVCFIKEDSLEEIINKMIQENANLLIVCNPNNPTGMSWSTSGLVELITRLQDIGGLLILDEVYKDLTFDNRNRFSDSIDALNLIRVGSLSKSFGAPGLRLGYIQSMNFELIECLKSVIQHNYTSLSSFTEHFLENVDVNIKHEYLTVVLSEYKKRMDKVKNMLEDLGYIIWPYQAAFYLYVESRSANDLYEELKEKYGILSVSGKHYGHNLNCARLSLGVSEAEYDRLIKALEKC